MRNQHKVLGIVGSPRLGGNTEVLVDEVLAGAKEAGALVEKIRLRDLKIEPCKACDGCAKTRRCVIQDDLSIIRDKMIASDYWIFGTPVYYSGPTAQFKAFMDRWYSIDQTHFKDKRVILAVPLGDKAMEAARFTLGTIKDALAFQGSQVIGDIVVADAFEIGSVHKYPESLQQARQIGKTLN